MKKTEGKRQKAKAANENNLAKMSRPKPSRPSGSRSTSGAAPNTWAWACVKLSTLSPTPLGAIGVRHANYTANKWSATLDLGPRTTDIASLPETVSRRTLHTLANCWTYL